MPYNPDNIIPRRELFIHKYVLSKFKLCDGKSAEQIAIEVGYSKRSAYKKAYDLLGDQKIKKGIEELRQKILDEYTDQAREIVEELDIISKQDIRNYSKTVVTYEVISGKGKVVEKGIEDKDVAVRLAAGSKGIIIEHKNTVMKDILEMGDEARAISAIEYIPTKCGNKVKLKFWDKPKCLELLGKHHKLYTDKVEHSGQTTGQVMIVLPDNGKGPKPESK